MFVSCVTFTGGVDHDTVLRSISSFEQQDYGFKQLVIVNNSDVQISPLFNRDLLIIDRLGFSNGLALRTAIESAAGQIIAHYPLNYFHFHDRLTRIVEHLDCNLIVAPDRYIDTDGVEFIDTKSSVVPELAAYKSPSYFENYDIEWGAWWQYPLLMNKHGIDIINIPESMSQRLQ
jgi:hypothetical protein